MNLIDKYNIPVPRYTSYPTVPYWENNLEVSDWQQHVLQSFIDSKEEGISLYIHLPFCESLCTYCGCNKIFTKNHSLEHPYIEAVIKEWGMYRRLFGEKPKLRELHLGGGTPTFFSAENLQRLVKTILDDCELADDVEMGLEVHPAYTNEKQLSMLHELGFTRISLGVQDFDPKVQRAINRPQSVEEVRFVTETARKLGYTSVNFDLIFGLPFQEMESILKTFEEVAVLRPDRIAFYSYAHVPWTQKAQRLFSEDDLPKGKEKRRLYELGRQLLEENGYQEIGMDHFALKGDSLFQAMETETMHRNFMGYTSHHTKLMVGLGVSSIGDSWTAFAQNEKGLNSYYKAIEEGRFPVMRGHQLTDEDLVIRQHILNLMCKFRTSYSESDIENHLLQGLNARLKEMEDDGLLGIFPKGIMLSQEGKSFVRNVCMAFDYRLWDKQPETRIFSQAV